MGISLGLWFYVLTARRRVRPLVMASDRGPDATGDAGSPALLPARPAGKLVWIDAASASAAQGVAALAQGLKRELRTDAVLVSCPEPVALPPWIIPVAPPADAPDQVRAFLDHWRPDLGIVVPGVLRPVLLHEAWRRDVPLMLVEGSAPTVGGIRGRWWPGLISATLAKFAHVLVLDTAALRLFRRSGAPPAALQVCGRMEEPSRALACTEAERAALARAIGNRPVWLAVAVPEAEDQIVAEAHLAALRMAHRLLLIVVPDDPARAGDLAERFTARHSLSTARRSAEQEPDDDTEVYIADTEGELGLWYRLAPIVYMGGTLTGTGVPRHPFEAAALGAAIVHGGQTGPHAEAFERLLGAGASRALPAPADLGEAVGDLLAPDRAARLARAAWDATSAGAEATREVLRLARALLDRRLAPPAAP